MKIIGSLLILQVIGFNMTDYHHIIKDISLVFGIIGIAILFRERRKQDN
jgi:hypothetical protein